MDSLKTTGLSGGGGDPASSFLNFIWHNYISSGDFWGIILIVFLLMWLGRTFIFDNKNLKINSKSWFYPLCFFSIIIISVWLKSQAVPEFSRSYISDLLITMSVIAICYTAFGHKLLVWASKWATERLGLAAGYEKKEVKIIEQAGGLQQTTEITQTTEKDKKDN